MNKTSLKKVELALPGVLLISPLIRRDRRGFLVNVYTATEFAACGINASFVEDFTSYSKKGVLRGLHFQRVPYRQDKLVRCTKGEIFDVVADCDSDSATYGQYIFAHLKGEEQTMLYIPGAYAHGFCVLSDGAIVEYKLSNTYHPDSADGARFDDQLFNIKWPVVDPILSDQDKSWQSLPNKGTT